ncbi:MAG: hypothetical protein QW416_08485 [Candidatus Nitrosocaldaceae archaeon]
MKRALLALLLLPLAYAQQFEYTMLLYENSNVSDRVVTINTLVTATLQTNDPNLEDVIMRWYNNDTLVFERVIPFKERSIYLYRIDYTSVYTVDREGIWRIDAIYKNNTISIYFKVIKPIYIIKTDKEQVEVNTPIVASVYTNDVVEYVTFKWYETITTSTSGFLNQPIEQVKIYEEKSTLINGEASSIFVPKSVGVTKVVAEFSNQVLASKSFSVVRFDYKFNTIENVKVNDIVTAKVTTNGTGVIKFRWYLNNTLLFEEEKDMSVAESSHKIENGKYVVIAEKDNIVLNRWEFDTFNLITTPKLETNLDTIIMIIIPIILVTIIAIGIKRGKREEERIDGSI